MTGRGERTAGSGTGPVVRPTHDDPVARNASEVLGGPLGGHAAPHPWWSPVRVVLAVACLAFLLGMLQKYPCVSTEWTDTEVRYAAMCYSDVPYLYDGRGFADRAFPYDGTADHQAMEYPVVIGYFAYGAALLTHGIGDAPDRNTYFLVTAVLLGAFALLAVWFLSGAQRGRPWDAMLFAAAPSLVLAGLINWDLVAVAAVAGALWAWARGRPVLSGVFIGVGAATKLYPLFLLGALLVVCLRRRELRAFGAATVAAVGAWLAVNLPAMLLGFEQWQVFWSFNSGRGADLGSVWLVLQQAGATVTPELINAVSLGFFAAWCLGVLLVGLRAPRTPRIASLAFLVVLGFLLVNKVYSPQYVLWLLPLAVLARPRWRDLLVWQAGEVFYFAAVWWYLGELTASGASGEPDRFYWLAILLRIAAQLYLGAVVLRDVRAPWRDPVRADAVTDDPLQPSHT